MRESRFHTIGRVLDVQDFPVGPAIAWVSTANVVYDDQNQPHHFDPENGGGVYPVLEENIGETAVGGFMVVEANLAAKSPADVNPVVIKTQLKEPTDEELGLN